MILAKDLSQGRNIWYRHSQMNEETHKMEREYGRGTVTTIEGEGRNIMAGIETENGGSYVLKPYDLYRDEYEMKMDRAADKFEDHMMDFAEKYVNQCSNLIKGITSAAVPQNVTMAVNDVKLRIQMIGSHIKDRFTEHTDHFLEETRELTLEDIEKKLGKEEDIQDELEQADSPAFEAEQDGDLSNDLKDDGGSMEAANKKDKELEEEKEEELTLTEEDLKFVPQQETLKL